MAGAAVVSMEEVSEVAVSTAAVLVVGSTGEASAVVLSTAVVVSVGDVSPVAVSMAVAFAVAVLVGAITDSLMMFSSVVTVIRGGGTGAIHTDIMVTTTTRTIIMDTADTRTMDTAGTVTTVAAVTDTAIAADQGISGVRGVGDKPVRRFEIARLLVRAR
jgi:hypothetical protein